MDTNTNEYQKGFDNTDEHLDQYKQVLEKRRIILEDFRGSIQTSIEKGLTQTSVGINAYEY